MANWPIDIRVFLTYYVYEVMNMPNYEKMYFMLFNAITDAVRLLEENKIADASLKLMMAQYNVEELYISAEE